MASGSLRLTAEQTIAILQCPLQFNFDMTHLYEVPECTPVLIPGSGSLLIGAQHVRCRRKDLQVHVADLIDVAKKEGNVIAFRKSRQLSRVAQSNIYNAANSGGLERSEEFFGTFLGEPYGEKRIHTVLHGVVDYRTPVRTLNIAVNPGTSPQLATMSTCHP